MYWSDFRSIVNSVFRIFFYFSTIDAQFTVFFHCSTVDCLRLQFILLLCVLCDGNRNNPVGIPWDLNLGMGRNGN